VTENTTTPYRARTPLPEDFRVEWDEEHTFDFFEDENATALWAHGSLDSEEFVRQANEYDRITDDHYSTLDDYSIDDVRTFWGILRYQSDDFPDDWRVYPCDEHTSGAALVKVIDR
jgi:hypothetical protein